MNFQKHVCDKFIIFLSGSFALSLNSEQIRVTEDITAEDEHNRTEDLSAHVDNDNFATKLENAT